MIAGWILFATLPLTAGGEVPEVAPALGAASLVQNPPPGNRLDLPALIVSPLDLHATGITGFGSDHGVMYHTIEEALADEFAASRGYMTLREVPGIEQTLATSGWLQYHEQRYGMLDPADPDTYSQIFAISVEQYATPEGATSAFVALTSEQALATATTAVTRQPLSPTTPPSGQAAAWIHEGYTDDPSLDRRGVTLMLRVDTLIVSMTQINFLGVVPDQATVERAMFRQLDRISAAQTSGTSPSCLPGGAAGLCVQRVFGQGMQPEVARYIIRDGVIIPWDTTTPTSLLQQQAEAAEFNVLSAYRNWSYLDAPGGRIIVHHMLYSLPDDASAATYHDYLFGPGSVTGTQSTPIEVPGATAAATFVSANSANTLFATYSHARVGNHVIVVAIDGTVEPVPGITEGLLTSQVGCFQAGNCLTPVAPSPELLQAVG